MPTYLVERYLQGMTPELLVATARHAKKAAELASAAGAAVRYLHSTFLPQDEMAFCLFEADSAVAVAEANEAAGIAYERIVEAVHLDAGGLARATPVRPSGPGGERRGSGQVRGEARAR